MEVAVNRYWDALVREYEALNKTVVRFTRPLTLSPEAAAMGQIENPWQEDRTVYVLPFQAVSPHHELDVLVPLWLPATLTADGRLIQRAEPFLAPYVPFTFLEKEASHGIVLGELAFYERALLETSLPTDSKPNWSSYYAMGCRCLEETSQGAWKERLIEAGYTLQETVWVVDAAEVWADKAVLAFEAAILAPLLQPVEEEPIFFDPETLSLNELLSRLMVLKDNQIQAIQLSEFKEKNPLLHAFLERSQDPLKVCVLSPDPEAWAMRAISDEIQTLQKQDEHLEKMGDSLYRLLVLWQAQQKKAKSGWRQWMGWLLPSKKKDFERFFSEFRQQPKEIQERFHLVDCSFDELEKHLVDALSQIRVDRTCLHRTLTKVCDRQPVVQVIDPREIYRWNGQVWDLCIIDEAQTMAPWQVASFLAHSKKGWVLAHSDWPKRRSSVSAHLDFQCAEHFRCIQDEMDFETLEWSGSSSTGNVWQWVCAKNPISPVLWALENKQTEPPTFLVPVQGHLQQLAGSYYNRQEVDAIVDWVASHVSKDIAIVTPFEAQKALIVKALRDKGLKQGVYILGEIEARPHEIILFSATYEATSKRPFVFDLGDEPLTWLNAMAKSAIGLVGDESLWNAGIHSPSGRLAKRITKLSELIELVE